MRASRALAVTATAFAAAGLAAPLAFAGGAPGSNPTNTPTNVTVRPSSVHQGGTMHVSAEGCGRAGGKVWSNAFPTVNLSPGRVGYATARIRDNATPGHYHLSVKCNQDNGQGGNGREDGRDNGREDERDNGREDERDNGREDEREDSGRGGNGDEGRGGNGGSGGNGGGDNAAVATHKFTVLASRGAQGGLGGSMGPSSVEMQIGGGLVAAAAVGGAAFIARRRRMSNASA